MLIAGRLSDILGRRYFAIGGNVSAVIGGIIAARAQSVAGIVGGMIFLGLGAAIQLNFPVFIAEGNTPASPSVNMFKCTS